MTEMIKIGKLNCLCCKASGSKIAYILYPMDVLGSWIEQAAQSYGVTIVVITGMNWDDDLSPWPASGVPEGCSDFKGHAAEFLSKLQTQVIPEVESRLGIAAAERDLVGVSMSGLFTLWQWAVCDTFRNIASLSGSFWYEGFPGWFDKNFPSHKEGNTYFLLGELEHNSKVPQFTIINDATHKVVGVLKRHGVNVRFDMVPGNHYQFGIERLNKAFSFLYPTVP